MFRFSLVRRWNSSFTEGFKTYVVYYRHNAIGFARVTESRETARSMGIRHAWAYSADGATYTLLDGYTTRDECARRLAVAAGFIADSTFGEQQPNRRTRRAARIPGRSEGRVFGVEMEITSPAASVIINALQTAGVPMNRRNVSMGHELPYDHTNTVSNVWTLKHDGSVSNYGLELVSPKLSGEAGFNAVRTVCRVLNEVGATVDRTTGLHVHHDFRGMDLEAIRTQAMYFLERQDSIMRMVAPSRRNNNYSIPWSEAQINQFRTAHLNNRYAGLSFGPRGSINLYAFSTHGSVEIRAHGGTVNANKIIAWIKFGQAIFAAAVAGVGVRGTAGTNDVEGMLTDLMPFGLDATDAAVLLRFVTVGESRNEVERRLLSLRAEIVELEELSAELV